MYTHVTTLPLQGRTTWLASLGFGGGKASTPKALGFGMGMAYLEAAVGSVGLLDL